MQCFALIDFDNLVYDVSALYIAIARAETKDKLDAFAIENGKSIDAILDKNLCDKTQIEIIQRIREKIFKYSHLCRPYINSLQVLKLFIGHDIGFNVLFVTLNPTLTLQILNYNQNLLELNNITPEKNFKYKSKVLIQNIHIVGPDIYIDKTPDLEFLTTSGLHYFFLKSPYLIDSLNIPKTAPWIARDKDSSKNNSFLLSSLDAIDWQACPKLAATISVLNIFKFPDSITKVQPLKKIVSSDNLDKKFWKRYAILEDTTVFEAVVVSGRGLGATELGIPTANLDCTTPVFGPDLPFLGVYFGYASLKDEKNEIKSNQHFKTVFSVGYNPYYDNSILTVEPYLYKEFDKKLNGCTLKLVVVGVLRAESNFESFEKLLQGIQFDAEIASEILDDYSVNNKSQFDVKISYLY